MDLEFWGFKRWPFERSLVADRFFVSPLHEEAMARLLFLIEESRQTGVMVGPGGCGKTYLLKLVQQRAERLGRLTIRSEATGLDGHEFICGIAAGCHVPCDPDITSARVWNGIQKRFTALAVIQQLVVIVIDHFDSVDFRCQQAVVRLRQLADAIGVKLTMILATRGQILPAELQDVVELRIDIGPWTVADTSRFIRWSIEKAGSQKSLFNDDAIDLIHQIADGIPAAIVTICNLALLAARAHEETSVNQLIVDAVQRELMPSFANRATRAKSDDDRVMMPTQSR